MLRRYVPEARSWRDVEQLSPCGMCTLRPCASRDLERASRKECLRATSSARARTSSWDGTAFSTHVEDVNWGVRGLVQAAEASPLPYFVRGPPAEARRHVMGQEALTRWLAWVPFRLRHERLLQKASRCRGDSRGEHAIRGPGHERCAPVHFATPRPGEETQVVGERSRDNEQ